MAKIDLSRDLSMVNLNIILRNSFLRDLYHQYNLNKMKRKWRINNAQNDTKAMNIFDLGQVSVGKASYGELNVVSFGNNHKLQIGNFVSIAQHVTFLLDVEHYIDHISTYPFKVSYLQLCEYEAFGKGDIIIDDDVWVGYGATILSGVHIGQGAVVAAGAVVTKDIPPYAIAAGVPAKVVKYRFSEELIEELLKVDFGKLEEGMVREHIDDLYEELERKEQLAWLPRKET